MKADQSLATASCKLLDQCSAFSNWTFHVKDIKVVKGVTLLDCFSWFSNVDVCLIANCPLKWWVAESIYILDMYNSDIYPRARLSSPFLDMYEKQIIQIQFSVHSFLSQSVCKQAQYCGNEMRNGGNGARSSTFCERSCDWGRLSEFCPIPLTSAGCHSKDPYRSASCYKGDSFYRKFNSMDV